MKIDFAGLASYLKVRTRELVPTWLPGGKLVGKEYECGSLNGEKGKSLKVNFETGLWMDFATGDKGGDLISLYAAVERISQKESFSRLAEQFHFTAQPTNNVEAAQKLISPPKDVPTPPSFSLGKLDPTKVWEYKDARGKLLFYVARYDKDGGKEFRPWSWSTENLWVAKAWPDNRPLYGLELLKKDRPVLVVEGEKAADAARKLQSVYDVVSWMNGANGVSKTDWRPLRDKKILLWPDADEPGKKAMENIAEILYQDCPEIKILNVENVSVVGWDAADALDQGWDYKQFKEWAAPNVKKLKPIIPSVPSIVVTETQASVNVHLIPDDVPQNITWQAIWDSAGVVTTKNGAPVINSDSILKLLRYDASFAKHIWYDEFHAKIFTDWDGKGAREWKDTDETNMAAYFQREIGFMKVGEDQIRKAIFAFVENNVRNEPKDWMKSLTWDTLPRIEFFFSEYMGVKDNEYTRAASRNFWISMAARIFKPGCKADTMIILEGPQGKLKSTALQTIAGKWFGETGESPNSKDFVLGMQGKLILEVAELDSFSKTEVNTLKRILSCVADRIRPPYERYPKDFPRQVIFTGSTNDDRYLNDPTGARRFWPQKIHKINIEKIKEDREQLFAEAVYRLKQGESWWVMPQSTEEEQEQRRQVDAWEDVIQDAVIGINKIKMNDLAKKALNIDNDELTKATQMRIGKILKMHGWHNKRERDGTNVRMVWVREE